MGPAMQRFHGIDADKDLQPQQMLLELTILMPARECPKTGIFEESPGRTGAEKGDSGV